MKITQALKSYYGAEEAEVYNDTDFDIVDTYTIPANKTIIAFLHSHGTAHPEIYDGTAWIDVEGAGAIPIVPTANKWRVIEGTPRSRGGTNSGSIRIAGSGVDNSTLRILIGSTVKTEG